MKPLPSLAIGLLLTAQTVFWIVWRAHDPRVSVENGPMEVFQAFILVAGFAVIAWAASHVQSSPHRVLLGSLALFYVTFVFGEIDMRSVGSPLLELIFDGAIRNLALAALWVAALVAFWRHRNSTWRLFHKWLPTFGGVLLLLAGCCWFLSGIIDKLDLFSGSHHFFEELTETNATVLMFLAAYMTARSLWHK